MKHKTTTLKKRSSHVGAIAIAVRCREAWAVAGRNSVGEAIGNWKHKTQWHMPQSAIQTHTTHKPRLGIRRTTFRIPAQRGEVCSTRRSARDTEADARS